MAEAGPPQGWYEDPQDASRLRWWDGAAWTDHTHERPAEDPAAGGGDSAATDPPAGGDDAEREAEQLLAMDLPSPSPATTDDPARRLLPWLIGGVVLLIALGATAIIVGDSGGESDLPAQTNPPLDPEAEAADGQAQEQARTAQAAIEAYATDNGGSYEGATPEELVALEPTLSGATITVEPATDNYTLSVESTSGNSFTVTRDSAGGTTFTCGQVGAGGCPASGFWG